MLIDTHAHLNFLEYEKDLDIVIKNSVGNGVSKIICASSNIEDSQKAIEIAKKYPHVVYASVGIHPQQTDVENQKSLENQIEKLKKLSKEECVVAIGECGLDFSPAPPGEKDRSKEEQFFIFKKQIELSLLLKLPLIIHSRKAFDDVLAILNEYIDKNDQIKGVFHCYSGGKNGIEKVKKLGFYFGIDGNVTYDLGLQNVAKEIPEDRILLETDSPFLSPIPYRGLRNEPQNVKITAELLAQLKEQSFEKVVKQTTFNAEKLFPKTR